MAFNPIFGALVGDSMGSFIEFNKSPKPREITQALQMPGGGPHQIGPGQITDDGELTLALWYSMSIIQQNISDPKIKFYNQQYAGEQYIDWFKTRPFDIGTTTYKSVSSKSYEEMLQNAKNKNSESKANGGLMRITPLITRAIITNAKPQEVISACFQDAQLTHPNITLQVLNAYYVLTGIYMIKNYQKEYDTRCQTFVEKTIIKYLKDNDILEEYQPGYDEVIGWVEEAFDSSFDIDTEKMKSCSGFVKWGFQMAIYCLTMNFDYVESMSFVLQHGCDTDTNCAIVGGLISCKYGLVIPQKYLEKIKNAHLNKTYLNRGHKWLLPYQHFFQEQY